MSLYDAYHKNRKLQKRILNERDFTYRNVIGILKNYIKKGNHVLDIGCGTGAIDFYLAANGCTVTGFDISENAIRVAKKNATNFNLIDKTSFFVSDFAKAGIKNKFDLIICSEVLEHLIDDAGAVRKICSCLKRGGILIASSPSLGAPLYKLGLLKKFDKRVGHLRRYNTHDFCRLFLSNKLKIVKIVETEGVVRNLMFTNEICGFFVRFTKGPIADFVTIIDNFSIKLFGCSQIIVISQKK